MKIIKKIKKILGIYKQSDIIKELKENGCNIGEDLIIYAPQNVLIDMTSAKFISIGNNVQITDGCKILAHDYSYSVVANLKNELLRPQRKTIIGNNVFIGMNSVILMGANIGNNVIIGAGSIVSGTIESNSVYAGNPAKKICTIDEYYLKLKENYEKSAYIYLTAINDNGKNVSNKKDFNIYQTLFEDEKIIKNYIKSADYKGIKKEVLKNLTFDAKKYDTIEEFLEKVER